MGRESVTVCHWQNETAEVKLHLDADALTLRGDIRLTIPRVDIRQIKLCEPGLCLTYDGQELILEFNAVEAERWRKALCKAPPTLAQKLGISEDAPAFVHGTTDDPILMQALTGAQITDMSEASIILALVVDDNDLEAAAGLARSWPDLHIWMIYTKGKQAVPGDAAIRTHMRGAGFIDSKSCAVSDRLTATRYRLAPPT